MLDGLESISRLSPQRRRDTLKAPDTTSLMHGKQILEQIYGKQTPRLLRHLDELYPGLALRITHDAYGLIMHRAGLTLQERELVNVVVLYALDFDRQLYSHLRGAIRVGVRTTTLKTIILITAKTIGKRSKQSLDTIDSLKNA
jgi:4-carboxymuconolactone decarboxylase